MDDQRLFSDLSRRLREAHRRVGVLPVGEDEKARVARHLIAITDASKHDLGRASTRLDRLVAEMDELEKA